MSREQVPPSAEADSFSEVFSWERAVKVAEAILVNSPDYERAHRTMQPYWRRCIRYMGESMTKFGMDWAGVPNLSGCSANIKDLG